MKLIFLATTLILTPSVSSLRCLTAQEPVLIASTEAASEPSSTAVTAPAKTPKASHALTERWLDLTAFSHSERYRNAFELGGPHVFDNAQSRSLIAGTVKLDAQGRYRIGFRASSGRYFNWAFSNYTGGSFIPRVNNPAAIAAFFTPAQYGEVVDSIFADPAGFALTGPDGLQSNGWEFYMRELYFSATPIKFVTVEFGSFGIERGYGTEITTFDEDGYLAGERIRLRAPNNSSSTRSGTRMPSSATFRRPISFSVDQA